jgi:hypothetical protein
MMTAELIGIIVDKGITLLAGIYFTLLGFGLVGKKKGQSAEYDAKMAKVAPLFKICGPILIVIALVLIAAKLLHL